MKHGTMLGCLGLLACNGPAESVGPGGQDSDSQPSCEESCDTPSLATADKRLETDSFLSSAERTRNNPLKGLMSSYLWGEPASDFPDQLEFLYVSMADLWGSTGDTLDTGLEPHLEAAAGRNHHVVLRVYVDYPAGENGLPAHLASQVDCEPYFDHGGGCSPDYDDPALLEAMLGLISALGDRYDADPRLGFVQVGLLGFWGEWHTWPHDDWFPSEQTQNAVLTAFESAFSTTHLQVRRPAASSVEMRIGFHDDSFGYSTMGEVDWFFLPDLEAAGAMDRWQEVPIGGEVRPELQGEIFEPGYETDLYAQDALECIAATHASYLLNYQAFNGDGVGYTGEERERAEAAALSLGYQFEVGAAMLSASELLDDTVTLRLSLDVSQTGVAPFYYSLNLSVASDALGAVITDTGDLKTLLPGETRTVSVDLGRASVDVLQVPMEIQLTSPMLQPGQSIAFATKSEWDQDTGPLTLVWEFGCEMDSGELYKVDDVVAENAEGCDCICDVDGQPRACGEQDCR